MKTKLQFFSQPFLAEKWRKHRVSENAYQLPIRFFIENGSSNLRVETHTRLGPIAGGGGAAFYPLFTKHPVAREIRDGGKLGKIPRPLCTFSKQQPGHLFGSRYRKFSPTLSFAFLQLGFVHSKSRLDNRPKRLPGIGFGTIHYTKITYWVYYRGTTLVIDFHFIGGFCVAFPARSRQNMFQLL